MSQAGGGGFAADALKTVGRVAVVRVGAAPRSAGEFSGLVAEEDAVDEGADGGLFVGVEVGEGFEAELPHVVGGGVRLGLPRLHPRTQVTTRRGALLCQDSDL